MTLPDTAFRSRRTNRLLHPEDPPATTFPIQSVHIDWDRLITEVKRLLGLVRTSCKGRAEPIEAKGPGQLIRKIIDSGPSI